jgi:hypothetical protein
MVVAILQSSLLDCTGKITPCRYKISGKNIQNRVNMFQANTFPASRLNYTNLPFFAQINIIDNMV